MLSQDGFSKLWKKAEAYAKRMGLGDDSEDFAQEVVMQAFEKGLDAVRMDFTLKSYLRKERAQKRLLGSAQGTLSANKTISFDAPLGSSEDSGAVGDLIACTAPRAAAVVEVREEISECKNMLDCIFDLVKDLKSRTRVKNSYMSFVAENI